MGNAAAGEVYRPRHAVSRSVGTITDNIAGRIGLADPDLPHCVAGDGAAEVTRRSPDNLRGVAADSAAGVAVNIVGARYGGPGLHNLPWRRGGATDGVEILAVGISRAVHEAASENEPLCPVMRCSGQPCRVGERRIPPRERERRCARKACPAPAKRVKRQSGTVAKATAHAGRAEYGRWATRRRSGIVRMQRRDSSKTRRQR